MKSSRTSYELIPTTTKCLSGLPTVQRGNALAPTPSQPAQVSVRQRAGIVFSEYALANPSAWAYYRPILEENQGWAAFITTPRGRNHALALFQYASQSADWFCELLTASDTGALTDETLAETMKEYCSLFGKDQGQAMYDQELLCSWNASVLGAYFAGECDQVRREERIMECEALR